MKTLCIYEKLQNWMFLSRFVSTNDPQCLATNVKQSKKKFAEMS